jgi:ATP-binding cassette subfamily B protein
MKVFQFIWEMIKPFRWYLMGPVAVMTIFAVSLILRPYLTKLLIDAVVSKQGQAAVTSALHIAGFYILLQFFMPMCWRFYDWCSLNYEPALRNHIGDCMTKYLSKHSHHYYQNNFAGSLASKVVDTYSLVITIITTIINRFYAYGLVVILAIFALWQIHFWFALAMFLWAGLFVTFAYFMLRRFNQLATVSAEASSKIVGNIVDFLSNMSSVRYFVAQKTERERLLGLQDEYLQSVQTRRWFMIKVYSVQGFLFAIYQTTCLLLLIYLYTLNKVTAGDFAMILALNMAIIEGLWEMSNEMRVFSENIGSVEQALKTIYVPHEIDDQANASSLKVKKGQIVFDNVQFQYKDNSLLFANKSVVVEPGQKVGLVGHSGSGKSTFVNLILRLFDVTEGKILIDGQDIKTVTQNSLRECIGMIPQDPSLFHRTLMENIRYGKMAATDTEVVIAAKKAHADEFISILPTGYHSLVGERGVKLSGGQRQRVAIARAFLKNAPILILDEATSQLDSLNEQYIQESLWQLMQDKTTIVIAHRLSTLLNMDRILVFDQGKIIEDGTHEELLAQNGAYKTLWDAQVGGFLLEDETK